MLGSHTFSGVAASEPPGASREFAEVNGDVNADGTRDISDAISLLSWLFNGGPAPALLSCPGEVSGPRNGDTNGDGAIDLSDTIYLLGWLFNGGAEPVAACEGRVPDGDYCFYFVISGFHGIDPPLGGGDIICVDCPDSGKCPGPSSTNFTAEIEDLSGTKAKGKLRKDTNVDECQRCPSNGKTGYEFVD